MSPRPRAPKAALVIDVRDQRLPGGRLRVSARTTSRPEARRREAAVRALLDAGEFGVLERLRARQVHIADLQRAHEAGQIVAKSNGSGPLSIENDTGRAENA